MSYRDTRELARIRYELRMRLLSRRYDGTAEILRRLEHAATSERTGTPELRSEYERWRARFEMLAAASAPN
jgi:hypothetical protein